MRKLWIFCVFTDDSRFKVDHDSARDMLSASGFTEECAEGVVSERGSAADVTGRKCSIAFDAVFETVQLPACVSYLNTGLSHVDGDTFALQNTH